MSKLTKLVIVPVSILALVVILISQRYGVPVPSQPKNNLLTKEEAVAKVAKLPEVADYMKRIPQAKVEAGGEETNSYLIQVFEVKDGHTATFNWYTVNKTTGEVNKEFN